MNSGFSILFIVVFLGMLLLVYLLTGSSPEVINCKLSKWSSWKTCDDSCPPGKNRVRTREVIVKSKKGKPCGDLVEHKTERIDCKLNEWTDWRPCEYGECTEGNNEIRTRTIKSPANEYGTCEGDLVMYRDEQPTAKDCTLGGWSEWRPCTTEDECPDGNTEVRTRGIDQAPVGAGMVCGALAEHRKPLNCTVSEWSTWTPCASDCEGEYRERTILTDENALGSCPERSNLKETRNVPEWGRGKICGETDGDYCLMPLGSSCPSDKNITNTTPNYNACKDAIKELVGPQLAGLKTVNVPKYCSYKQGNDGRNYAGGGPSWSMTSFDEYMAVCMN